MKTIRIELTASRVAVVLLSVALMGAVIQSGASSDLASVNTNKALEVIAGKSSRATYYASSSALVTTAAYNLSIESGASNGFRLSRLCVGWTSATAAAGITIAVNRRSTASSGGTALTAEGTGADSISKMDLGDGSWPGAARRTATLGTIGPTLYQTSRMVGEIGAGTADAQGGGPFCHDFGANGSKLPLIPAGTANGVSITVTAPGAGGLAFGSIAAELILE